MRYFASCFTLTFLVLIISIGSASGQSGLPTYYSQTDLALTSPGAMKFGLYGYHNPAVLSYLERGLINFTFNDQRGELTDFNRWGLFFADRHGSFGFIHHNPGDGISVTDYRLSVAGGNKTFSWGIGYGWSGGDAKLLDRPRLLTFGNLFRPNPYISLGLTLTAATDFERREGMADLAIRPLGSEFLSVFGDFAYQDYERLQDGKWSVGAALEAIAGVRVTGRYYENESLTVGIQMSLGQLGMSGQSHYKPEGEYSHNTYSIILGAYDRTFLRRLQKNKKYLKLDLCGRLKYQKHRWFDQSQTLSGVLNQIEAAQNDDSVGGIAINTSGLKANLSMIWEIREKLKDFQSEGKQIIIYIDNVRDRGYYLASIADQIVLDPVGVISLNGMAMSRTYFKGALEKLGVGFDEWRFFTYKSANETFSRDNMSEGDREQRQSLVDCFYQVIQSGICAGRNISAEEFDNWVNDELVFLPQQALDNGLVDLIGRWNDIDELIEEFEGQKKRPIQASSLAEYRLPLDNRWSEEPKIAVIYALGICAMDAGITARKLVKDVETVTRDKSIKAVVLRVDSPGGSALASDIIAEALKRCKKEKPVIISQGFVAASGGYWLSMYGD
ncbi:MAG: hypothetical protein GY869_32610, partial [Planctomycetes bacterium]|nr:hypothetical protein [Planctomycetota bacterium]